MLMFVVDLRLIRGLVVSLGDVGSSNPDLSARVGTISGAVSHIGHIHQFDFAAGSRRADRLEGVVTQLHDRSSSRGLSQTISLQNGNREATIHFIQNVRIGIHNFKVYVKVLTSARIVGLQKTKELLRKQSNGNDLPGQNGTD
jgi:hypothetical protein